MAGQRSEDELDPSDGGRSLSERFFGSLPARVATDNCSRLTHMAEGAFALTRHESEAARILLNQSSSVTRAVPKTGSLFSAAPTRG